MLPLAAVNFAREITHQIGDLDHHTKLRAPPFEVVIAPLQVPRRRIRVEDFELECPSSTTLKPPVLPTQSSLSDMSTPPTSANVRDLEIIGDAIDEGVWPRSL